MVCLSHGFGGRAKAMSKTARGCRARRWRRARQHPAILPWPSISLRLCRASPGFASRQPRCRIWLRRLSPSAVNARVRRAQALATDAEPLDQRLVPGLVDAPQIIEQLAALRHELKQAAPGMIVLDV